MRRVETVKPRVSYSDLERMPEDGNRYELYDGELYVVPAPLPIHQIVSKRLFLALHDFTKRAGGEVFFAPFDIVLSEYNVVQPDVLFFDQESAGRINPREHVMFTPTIAIEVLSPSTARNDRGRKRNLLARYGVPEYWIVDPYAKRVEVSILENGVYGDPMIQSPPQLMSAAVPGLVIDLDALFEGL
jgi:Uma2 family endonuclease